MTDRTLADIEDESLQRCWPNYYPAEAFSPSDSRLVLVRGFVEWLSGDGSQFLAEVDWQTQSTVFFSYDDFRAACPYKDFAFALRDEADDLLKCLDLALCVRMAQLLVAGTNLPAPCVQLHARIQNVTPLTALRDVKSTTVGKFISVRGNVIRVSPVRPLVQRLAFVCGRCGAQQELLFREGKYEAPVSCPGDGGGCRSRTFAPAYETAVTVDWQKVRVQELESDVADAGRVPRTLEVELSEDLVDAVVPGDVVTVGGVVRAMEVDVAAGKGSSRGSSLCLLYMDARSVASHKAGSVGGGLQAGAAASASQSTSQQFSERDLAFIACVKAHRDPFSLVVASAVPNIYGHETVKAGMLLGLFGGTPRSGAAPNVVAASDAAAAGGGGPDVTVAAAGGAAALAVNRESFSSTHVALPAQLAPPVSIRSDPHVLVVGDPGMGKSQMLQAIAGLAPRGVYVCGNTTSTTGLTVTLVRDSVTGDYGLEAGALLLSDQGVCCIDEFDKMKAEHDALLEAMEQQRISIAKAGIVSSLSARTTVIAAANPCGGHYDKGKTIVENLKLSTALLSRFDLIFIMLDQPDALRDRQLSEHVMAMHDSTRAAAAASAASSTAAMCGGGASQRRGAAEGSLLSSQQQQRAGGAGSAADGSFRAADASGYGLSAADLRRAAESQAAHLRAQTYAAAVEESRAGSEHLAGAASRLEDQFTAGYGSQYVTSASSAAAAGVMHARPALESRLRRGVLGIGTAELVPPPLLRKYVAYARKFCCPALLPEAAAVLQEFYLSLRAKHGSADSTPITTRQLEAMVRLSEARAKVELRDYVTAADARDIVELMQESLFDAATDDFGVVDFARASGMSKGKQVKAFVQALTKAAANRGHSRFTTDELQRFTRDLKLDVPSFADFLEILNQQSYLLKMGSHEWKLLTSGASR